MANSILNNITDLNSPGVDVCNIYTLSDPDSGMIRYVGKTIMSLNRRLSNHLSLQSLKDKNHKNYWIKKLIKEDKKPIIELLERVELVNWEESEIYWISQIKSWGFNLTNSTNGGNGLILSPEGREKQLYNLKSKMKEFRGIKYIDRFGKEKSEIIGKSISDKLKNRVFRKTLKTKCLNRLRAKKIQIHLEKKEAIIC